MKEHVNITNKKSLFKFSIYELMDLSYRQKFGCLLVGLFGLVGVYYGVNFLANPGYDISYMTNHFLQRKFNNNTINSKKKEKLLCWVHTTMDKHHNRVPSVNKTWLKRCDFGIFFTNAPMNDTSIKHYPLWQNNDSKPLSAFNKSIKGWTYVFNNISEKFDWYYKADDDTYMIDEKMREFLKNYDYNKPHYFGARFKLYVKNGYVSGSGMVFSYETVRRLNEALSNNSNFCDYSDFEDLGMAQCLAKLKIYPEKTTDDQGNHRFLPYNFQEMYFNTLDAPGWLTDPIGKEFDIFSPSLIQMHHVQPNDMLFIEALLYKVRKGSE